MRVLIWSAAREREYGNEYFVGCAPKETKFGLDFRSARALINKVLMRAFDSETKSKFANVIPFFATLRKQAIVCCCSSMRSLIFCVLYLFWVLGVRPLEVGSLGVGPPRGRIPRGRVSRGQTS